MCRPRVARPGITAGQRHALAECRLPPAGAGAVEPPSKSLATRCSLDQRWRLSPTTRSGFLVRKPHWDTYFAGRAAPLGLAAAEVVDALFYNFAPGEVARHIPKVWRTTTPEAAIAARQMGCVKALRRILGDRIDSPAFARAADLLTKAATSAPFEGRPMYAALRAVPIPTEVVARLFHAASLLREHRGDGHIAALMIEGVGRLEAHVLVALDMDMPAEKFGRIHPPPAAQSAAVIGGMRDRGLIGDDGWLSELGRAVKQRVEALTDDLAAKPYESLEPDELDELMATLEPLATLLLAAQD